MFKNYGDKIIALLQKKYDKKIPLIACFVILFQQSLSAYCLPSQKTANHQWKNNTLGYSDILLPGFDPIVTDKDTISIGNRIHTWSGSLLTNNISVNNEPIVRKMHLELIIKNKTYPVNLIKKRIITHSPTITKIETLGEGPDDIKVIANTTVEYDGLFSVKINITSEKTLIVDSINLIVDINKTHYSTLMGYQTKNIRQQRNRTDFIKTPYKGEFLNVVSVADGNKSFWWFSDNAKGWVWNKNNATNIVVKNGNYRLTQKIVSQPYDLINDLDFSFNHLTTPIKRLDSSWRNERVMWGVPSQKQKELGSKYKLWWTTAFSYDAFPHTNYPGNSKQKLRKNDLAAYPSLHYNKQLVKHDRNKWGMHWIPYYSAHVSSELDEIIYKNREQWEILPKKVFQDGLHPYSNDFDKPVMSHYSTDYTDYDIWRLNKAITELDVSGIYLDHGPVHDSSNLNNGGWYDSNKKLQSSLDILGTRSYLKRLRTLFHLNMKPGYIFIHISNREIIPAYTFAHGLIDGEQYRESLKDGDYLKLINLEEIRHRLSNKQYGILNYWLPVEWTNHLGDKSWLESQQQVRSYRRFMALSLLHDIPAWPQGSPKTEREQIIKFLDSFGISSSQFIGYWDNDNCATPSKHEIIISRYKHNKTQKSLLILTNISDSSLDSSITIEPKNCDKSSDNSFIVFTENMAPVPVTGNQINVTIDAHDFALILISDK